MQVRPGKKCKYMLTEDMEEAQGHSLTAASPVKRQSSGEASDVQTQILEQLKRVNPRLSGLFTRTQAGGVYKFIRSFYVSFTILYT